MHRFFTEKRPKVYALDEDEHREALLHETKTVRRDASGDRYPRARGVSLVFTLLGVALTALVSFWGAPILKDVDISYKTIQFNGSFLKENIYRRPAAPEVDEAWEALGINYRAVAVPHDEALKSGISPDQVKIAEKYGGGFFANVEGLHQLHCLNLVRQSLYYNFEYYHSRGKGPFANSDHIIRLHVSHCLDIVRQQLMCTIDTGVLGQVWWNLRDPEPFVDFNTHHKCKNYEAVRKWAEVRQVPEEVPDDYVEPPKKGDRIYEHVP